MYTVVNVQRHCDIVVLNCIEKNDGLGKDTAVTLDNWLSEASNTIRSLNLQFMNPPSNSLMQDSNQSKIFKKQLNTGQNATRWPTINKMSLSFRKVLKYLPTDKLAKLIKRRSMHQLEGRKKLSALSVWFENGEWNSIYRKFTGTWELLQITSTRLTGSQIINLRAKNLIGFTCEFVSNPSLYVCMTYTGFAKHSSVGNPSQRTERLMTLNQVLRHELSTQRRYTKQMNGDITHTT